jgi:hypothetical protein
VRRQTGRGRGHVTPVDRHDHDFLDATVVGGVVGDLADTRDRW